MTARPPARQRTFSRRRVLQVTPTAYDEGVRLLAGAIAARLGPVSAVVGVANGGVTPARGVGGLLGVPVYQVSARHNPTDALYTQATGEVACDVGPLADALAGGELAGQVLLVDDIYGSGATVEALRPALAPYLAPATLVRAVVLCRNASAAADPDLWLWTVDDWVRFPWEPAPPGGLVVEDLVMPGRVRPT
jgi:uncharacterized protein